MSRIRWILILQFAIAAVVPQPATAASPAAGPTDPAGRFAQPPAETRILKIIHPWPDPPEAQDQLIDRLQRQGFGGVVCNVSFDDYLESEAKWQAFTRAVATAKKAGMAMWLYDERGYPSGNAGGLTLRGHPEWEARGLLVADAESRGGPVSLDLPPGKPVLIAAFRIHDAHIDLTNRVDLKAEVQDGAVKWTAPEGAWRVLAITENRLYEGTHADGNLWAKIPYINLLQPEPTARFIELTHQAYADRLGPDLGRYFMGLFTDEPSLMSLFLKPMPYRPLPWASNLPIEFNKRRGYELDAGIIPALVTDAGPAGAKIRYDFWLTVGELVADHFFGQIQTWGRQHNIPSGGHLLLEEGIAGHVPLYGDFFRCIRRLDAPSIDCLTSLPSEVPWFVARLLSSAAELEGRSLVMSETSDHVQRHRSPGDKRPKRVVTEAEIRGTCNRLFVGGVNNITSYYSFADLADEQLRRLNEWVGRCALMLRGGHQVADIAVVYPAESLWTKFVPSRHWTGEAPAAARIESTYRAAADSLFMAQRDFTFVDSRALREAKVDSGALVHGTLRWRVVVLPGVDTLPEAAWENLARFVRSGGIAIALGARPANSESEFPSTRVQRLADEMFGQGGTGLRTNAAGGAGIYLSRGTEGLLPLVLDGVIEPDVKVAEGKSPVRVTHRRMDGHEVYFLINDSPQAWQGKVYFSAAGPGEYWNPATGQPAGAIPGNSAMVELEAYGAAFFRFAAARTPRRHAVAGGALPNFIERDLPAVTPTFGKGEFVHGKLEPDPAHSRKERPSWRAEAILTKSQVDTHLFVQFAYPQTVDLADADCLVLETVVPENQRTASQILVILHEKDGGDFIASTGRSLGGAGTEQSYVPLTQFKLTGWSKDGDGQLDLTRVEAIRVGWGGYFGKANEEIRFSTAAPQVGRVRVAKSRPQRME